MRHLLARTSRALGSLSVPWRLLLAALALAASGSAFAQVPPTCQLTFTDPSYYSTSSIAYLFGAVNTTTSVSFKIDDASTGGCSGTISGSIGITSDTTGGTTLSTASFSGVAGDTFTVNVDLGPIGDGTGQFAVSCDSGCLGTRDLLTVSFNTDTDIQLTPVGSTSIVANSLVPAKMTVNLKIDLANSVGSTIDVYDDSYNFLGSAVTNANGRASYSRLYTTPGSYQAIAQWNCGGDCYSGDPVNFNITVEPVSVTPNSPASGAADALSGADTTLVARLGSKSLPAPSGTAMTWRIDSQPSGGDGALSRTTATDRNGLSSAHFTAAVPGTYLVTADAGCRICAPSSYTFQITVSAPPNLTIVSGDGQARLAGTVADDPLVVELLDGAGNPMSGQTIDWSVTSGDATVTPSSVTDSAGHASTVLTFGANPGPVVVHASALAGSVATDFHETSANASSLVIIGGDGQTGEPSSTLPQPFVVKLIPPSGVTSIGGRGKPQTLAGVRGHLDGSGRRRQRQQSDQRDGRQWRGQRPVHLGRPAGHELHPGLGHPVRRPCSRW